MAKSLRSKRKQKILGIRKKKARDQELKKMWARHLLKQNGEEMQTDTPNDDGSIPNTNDEHSMEIALSQKISNSEMKKIEAKWGTRRSIAKKLKAKRLRNKKGHAQW